MFPPINAFENFDFVISPNKLTTVDFPFDPVIPITLPLNKNFLSVMGLMIYHHMKRNKEKIPILH